MTLTLSPYDRALLAGEHGPAAQLAMSILVRMAEVWGATELMDITGAHIDSTIYIGEAGLEYAERLASLGARVPSPPRLTSAASTKRTGRSGPCPPTGPRNPTARW